MNTMYPGLLSFQVAMDTAPEGYHFKGRVLRLSHGRNIRESKNRRGLLSLKGPLGKWEPVGVAEEAAPPRPLWNLQK